jgi:hypothetical protein
MTRELAAAAAAILGALFTGGASSAPHTAPFAAVFHDRACGARLCGTGVISGYGPVTSSTVFTGFAPGPEPGCVTFKGTRTATLVKDKRSTLRFAIRGPACKQRAWGTFKVVSGTGAFSNAGGSGVIWGTPMLVHYYGVIRLGR